MKCKKFSFLYFRACFIIVCFTYTYYMGCTKEMGKRNTRFLGNFTWLYKDIHRSTLPLLCANGFLVWFPYRNAILLGFLVVFESAGESFASQEFEVGICIEVFHSNRLCEPSGICPGCVLCLLPQRAGQGLGL
jgi:hypothetical protein